MNRWVKAHVQEQQSRAAVAASVSRMFDDVSTIDTYNPKAFNFDKAVAYEEDSRHDEAWPELKVKGTLLRLHEPGVTFKEDGARVTVSKDGEEQVWLKTPCVARQIRTYKRNV